MVSPLLSPLGVDFRRVASCTAHTGRMTTKRPSSDIKKLYTTSRSQRCCFGCHVNAKSTSQSVDSRTIAERSDWRWLGPRIIIFNSLYALFLGIISREDPFNLMSFHGMLLYHTQPKFEKKFALHPVSIQIISQIL